MSVLHSDAEGDAQVNSSADTPLRILGIGPLSWMQGYEHALLAAKLLIERGVPCAYRIVGSGEYFDAVAFARHQLDLEARVVLVQPSSCAEIRTHLRWTDVLVDASVASASPKPVLDAHAFGVPVITTESAHSGAALVVPRRDPDALAAALDALTHDRGLRARLVAAGRRRAVGKPNDSDRTAWAQK